MRDWLAAAAEKSPDALAVIYGSEDRSKRPANYASLNHTAAHYAARLTLAGVQRGDSVAILLAPGLLTVAVIHSLARLGAVLVPLHLRLTPEELRYQAEAANCKFVICDPENEANAVALRSPHCAVYAVWTPKSKDILSLPFRETPDWIRYLDGEIDLDAVQSIIFTSGTSGKPKGVQITFGNLYHSALASAERLGASPNDGTSHDRWLCPLPFYHVGGLSIIFRSAIYGSAMILPSSLSTEALAQALHGGQATMVSLVPTMLYRLLDSDFVMPPTLRLILLGGAAATPELVQRCIERNIPVALTYGLTEAASQVATATPEQVRAKPGSVGKPLDGTTVRVVDDEAYDQPPGIHGEIVVSGATVMRGYLGQSPTNGTIHTGDIGYLDSDGDLWLVQRRSDLIVSGGENVYPSEVEAVLRQHPAVADACVVGVPDAEWGQRVAAMVALRPGATLTEVQLIAFSRERLAGYKQPRRIVFVDELPQTASGKVQRGKVQEKLLATGD
jgi:O-succinylbenzoic acid--CoA ligase